MERRIAHIAIVGGHRDALCAGDRIAGFVEVIVDGNLLPVERLAKLTNFIILGRVPLRSLDHAARLPSSPVGVVRGAEALRFSDQTGATVVSKAIDAFYGIGQFGEVGAVRLVEQ